MANWKITRVNYKQDGDYRLISSLRWRADLYDSATGKSGSVQGTTSVEDMKLYLDSADAGTDSLGQQEYLDQLFVKLGYTYVDEVSDQLLNKVAVSAPIAVAPADLVSASVPYDDTDSSYWDARFDTLEYVTSKLERYSTEADFDSATRLSLIEKQSGYAENELNAVGSQFTAFGISIDSATQVVTSSKLIANDLGNVYAPSWVVNQFSGYYGDSTGASSDLPFFPANGLIPAEQEITDSAYWTILTTITSEADSHPDGLSCYLQYDLDSTGTPLGDSEGSEFYLGYGYFGDSVGNADSTYSDSYYAAGFRCQPTDTVVANPEVEQTKVMLGYFKPTETGSHTFSSTSNDMSYLWLGDKAIAGYTPSNALINNGGTHGTNYAAASITLTAGEYYPIRVLYGNTAGGPGSLQVKWFGPSTSTSNDWTGVIFHNGQDREDNATFKKGH
jgi:hypothetical protein